MPKITIRVDDLRGTTKQELHSIASRSVAHYLRARSRAPQQPRQEAEDQAVGYGAATGGERVPVVFDRPEVEALLQYLLLTGCHEGEGGQHLSKATGRLVQPATGSVSIAEMMDYMRVKGVLLLVGSSVANALDNAAADLDMRQHDDAWTLSFHRRDGETLWSTSGECSEILNALIGGKSWRETASDLVTQMAGEISAAVVEPAHAE